MEKPEQAAPDSGFLEVLYMAAQMLSQMETELRAHGAAGRMEQSIRFEQQFVIQQARLQELRRRASVRGEDEAQLQVDYEAFRRYFQRLCLEFADFMQEG